MLHRPARHQAAGALGKEADDLVAIALAVFEHAVDHPGGQQPARHGAEILLRGQVDDHRRGRVGQALVEVVGQRRAPVGIQVGPMRVGQPGAHLQPVGLQPVHRAQHAVQARQDHQVLLGPVELSRAQRAGRQAAVDIAVEGQRRRPAVGQGGLGLPGGVAADVEGGEVVGQIHQPGHLGQRERAQQADQLGRALREQRLSGARQHRARQLALVIQ